MAKHECQLPAGLNKTRWRCPDCWAVWHWDPNAGTGADLWHGRDNVRKADGSKPKGGFWNWLTT